jgi:hypothetical protein
VLFESRREGVMETAAGEMFKGATQGFASLFRYFTAVAEKVGMEQAIDLYAGMQAAYGATNGKAIKEQSGRREFDAMSASTLMRKSVEDGVGLTSQVIEESPRAVAFRMGRCPVYEGAVAAGLSARTVEALCRCGSLGFMDTSVKQLNPKLCYELAKMRSSEDDSCEERIYLK